MKFVKLNGAVGPLWVNPDYVSIIGVPFTQDKAPMIGMAAISIFGVGQVIINDDPEEVVTKLTGTLVSVES